MMKHFDWLTFLFVACVLGFVAAIVSLANTANEIFEYEYDNCLVKVEIVKTWTEPDRTIVDQFCK